MVYVWRGLLDGLEKMHREPEAVFRYAAQMGDRDVNLFQGISGSGLQVDYS